MEGRLILRKGNEKEKFDKYLVIEKIITKILYFIIVIAPLILSYFIFNLCIDKSNLNLANTISLGAIFATFGSAIISSVILFQTDKFNRILSNVDILYSDILHAEKWTRWPFIKRYKVQTLLDGKITSSILKNPNIIFKLGSYDINILIPTTQEDFYDLPSFHNFMQMKKNSNHFKTNIVNHPNCIDDTPFSNVGDYFFAWDCLYDIWKTIVLFKINKLLVTLGSSIIISSFIYSFASIPINNFITSIIK